ncbi:DUF1127 domain-containing protein [Escherichia coli]|nr:DUF1127 domain-containing protein [Escherichia coli]
MAHAHHIGAEYAGHSALGEWIRRVADVTREELKYRRQFKRTMRELAQLDDAQLADMGLNRSMIRSAAIEATYGPQE